MSIASLVGQSMSHVLPGKERPLEELSDAELEMLWRAEIEKVPVIKRGALLAGLVGSFALQRFLSANK